ncbi:hypothetical protein GTV32_09040 [Gordonia sp. SID5947]|uniref:hypothetical protein n=1 Tax=Gordonia sp. SID5947 TaxID=2690315 RepID=UPI00136ECF63|nr:hypothetical protein [Gordonia sp. SID5947]MYR06450.1 hypothetical protein [Gordonia sp. SID5947]
MAPLYQRSTAPADIDDLPIDMRAALDAHALANRLDLGDSPPAWLTRSVNPPSNTLLGKLFHRRANPRDPDSEHQTVVILHPRNLIVVVSGARRGISVLSVPLASASVSAASGPTGVPISGEIGFTVSGFAGEHGGPGSYHLGMGPEPAGTECAEAVRAAITAAKNP